MDLGVVRRHSPALPAGYLPIITYQSYVSTHRGQRVSLFREKSPTFVLYPIILNGNEHFSCLSMGLQYLRFYTANIESRIATPDWRFPFVVVPRGCFIW
jgi:hypothetical protein